MVEDVKPKRGGCRCGQVRFEAKPPAMITMACHCKGCQRMTGSAFSLSEMYNGENFNIIMGEPIIGGMKAFPSHYVCPNCASWIFTRVPTPNGEFVNIRTPMFDEANIEAPFIETCAEDKLDWVCTNAIHSFEKFPPQEEFPRLVGQFMARTNLNAN